VTTPALAQLVKQARDQAKSILATLEQTGHPQTNESSGVYLTLVTLQKRLSERAPTAPLREFVAELTQLAAMCRGKLEPLKPLLDKAVQLAGK
jgi:hypothetical protein